MEKYCLVAILLIWEFLHLCDSSCRVRTKICICFEHLKIRVGSWSVYNHYELLVLMVVNWYLSSTPPNCSLQQLRAQNNVFISAVFLLVYSLSHPLLLPLLAFGALIVVGFFFFPLVL